MYIYDDLDKYLVESEENATYLIKFDDKLAGFILVDFFKEKNILQEMFVLNNFKRKGVGSKAVKELFDNHRGNWEIKSLPLSEQAESFWTNTIKNYTDNKYNVEHIGKYNRAVISFNNEQ